MSTFSYPTPCLDITLSLLAFNKISLVSLVVRKVIPSKEFILPSKLEVLKSSMTSNSKFLLLSKILIPSSCIFYNIPILYIVFIHR